MYAIVDIAGQQFKVEKGKKIFVNRLEGEKGASLDFNKVLLTDDNGSVKVGTPYVEGVNVKATVVDHVKADKVLVFKKRRRKGYQKLNGHRQCLTQILIEEIA
ncbi:MAG TPA: 50S ribosomal protein L21 [Candidatus Coprenecus stercoravium]|uniref:Large ribosomal subunit protein bL21 n=1 Tax=Candidatus Coprenecus stercoravium TaxID=2840735 RepID=A0A9D2GMZ4_9BACT|nr:50S ribosomal protein L21 [Candidatus Coprenecus stercoravium]